MTNLLKGKKILCFAALGYHMRLLVPVMKGLVEKGARVTFFTAPAEAAFELSFLQLKLPFVHALDYLNGRVQEKINTAYNSLRTTWQDILLRNRVIQGSPLIIQDKILRGMIECLFCFEEMIDREKPDMVFALHEINSWGKELGYHCQERGIPFITFQEGLCYAPIPMYRLSAEYSTAVLCWGEADREILIQADNDPAKIVPVGNIDLPEAMTRVNTPEMIKQTRESLGIKDGEIMLLYLMSHALYTQMNAPEFVRWLWDNRHIRIVFKWHPIQTKEIVNGAMSLFSQFPPIQSIMDGDTYALMAAADGCVLVGNSTTGIEALCFRKPMVEVALPDHKYSFSSQGCMPVCGGMDDSSKTIVELIEKGIPQEYQDATETYLRRHFAHYENGFDGKTVERVVELAEKILSERESYLKSVAN